MHLKNAYLKKSEIIFEITQYPFIFFIIIFYYIVSQLKKIVFKYYLILFLSLRELRIIYVFISNSF
jgi:Na+/melibiose symporter-like transporter